MEDDDDPLTLESLPTALLENIFERLEIQDLARLSAVCKDIRHVIAANPEPFRTVCRTEFGITESPSTFHATWRRVASVGGDTSALAKRTGVTWARLEHWLKTNGKVGREILATLNPPASAEQLAEIESVLGIALPRQLKLVYSVHDGQATEIDRLVDRQADHGLDPSAFHGLFGGYCFYENISSTRLFPLSRLLRYTRMCRDNSIIGQESVVFAASFNFTKLFFLNTRTGQVRVTQADKRMTFPAGPEGDDGLVAWFEEYVHRSLSGRYGIDVIIPELGESSRGILLFPRIEPFMTRAVTRGIVVSASPLFIPEQSIERGANTRFHYAYSVRYSLQTPEEQCELQATDPKSSGTVQPPVIACQLATRHWMIRDHRGVVTGEVRGEGVIGLFPELKAGGPEFVYTSCTPTSTRRTMMGGDFRFAIPSIAAQQSSVDAVCKEMTLEVPEDFIF